ncbi:hypothetical protein AAVH_24041 [Aphelenchoides avenae]|nr:hypothetical protein AAVH_24041 [Aphelenchus avenae]
MLLYVEGRCAALRESTDPIPLYLQGLRASVDCPVRLSNMDMYHVETGFRAPPVFLHTGQALPSRAVGWSRVWIGVDLVFCVEMAKTLPVFRRLTVDEKELVLKHVAAASVMLTRLFFSASRNYPFMAMPDGTSIISPAM